MKVPHPLDAQGFVLSVYKERPWTSHDAVARVRRLLRYRRVGHTGTLDPFATGVLLCCVARATKLSGYLMDLAKLYEGTLRFGVQTTTGDLSGEVIREWAQETPPLDILRGAAGGLQGDILQVPPMVSALKHQGQRLYRLARQGVTVERQPRRVHVESFEIVEADGRRVRFRVRCARGTYVRTLVEDFGAALGASACVEELCRSQVGRFRVDEAMRLSGDVDAEGLLGRAIPMSEALGHLAAWRVPPFWVRRLRQGQPPPWIVIETERPPSPGEVGRLIGAEGHLVAMGQAVAVPGPAERPWQEALRLELLRVI